MVAKLSLVECMSVVEDPRVDRTKVHDLQDILVLSVLAVLCGADGWEDIELFAKIRFSWLKKFIKLGNGVPSHDTISRVFRMIRPDAFQEAFLAWVSSLDFGRDGLNVVAIDGKSLRRSHDKKTFKSMLHSVAAWSVANRVVLGCQSVDQKSNEITAIPELLKKLELKGAIITMDAMGSQDTAVPTNSSAKECSKRPPIPVTGLRRNPSSIAHPGAAKRSAWRSMKEDEKASATIQYSCDEMAKMPTPNGLKLSHSKQTHCQLFLGNSKATRE